MSLLLLLLITTRKDGNDIKCRAVTDYCVLRKDIATRFCRSHWSSPPGGLRHVVGRDWMTSSRDTRRRIDVKRQLDSWKCFERSTSIKKVFWPSTTSFRCVNVSVFPSCRPETCSTVWMSTTTARSTTMISSTDFIVSLICFRVRIATHQTRLRIPAEHGWRHRQTINRRQCEMMTLYWRSRMPIRLHALRLWNAGVVLAPRLMSISNAWRHPGRCVRRYVQLRNGYT